MASLPAPKRWGCGGGPLKDVDNEVMDGLDNYFSHLCTSYMYNIHIYAYIYIYTHVCIIYGNYMID